MDYLVIWRIDVDADTKKEAAQLAKEMMIDSETQIFEVVEHDNPEDEPETIEI